MDNHIDDLLLTTVLDKKTLELTEQTAQLFDPEKRELVYMAVYQAVYGYHSSIQARTAAILMCANINERYEHLSHLPSNKFREEMETISSYAHQVGIEITDSDTLENLSSFVNMTGIISFLNVTNRMHRIIDDLSCAIRILPPDIQFNTSGVFPGGECLSYKISSIPAMPLSTEEQERKRKEMKKVFEPYIV